MKPVYRAVICLLLLMLSGWGTAGATVYNWSRYDISFETPDYGFVTFNSNTRFIVQWEDMAMTVQLYSKDKGYDKKLLQENLMSKARGYNMYDLNYGKLKVKGFKKTYSIYGTMPDGSPTIIADLVSKHQNLIIEVTIIYQYGNREIAEDMIKSFAENKTQSPNHERKKQKVQKKHDADRQLEQEKKNKEPKRQTGNEQLYDA